MPLKIPDSVPERGYYFHYKRDPNDPIVTNFTYEVIGLGFHTETGEAFVSYRPLYREAAVYRATHELRTPCADLRPVEMWMEDVVVEGKKKKRFTKVTDPLDIAKLRIASELMYGPRAWPIDVPANVF